jgi:hypothetical protein
MNPEGSQISDLRFERGEGLNAIENMDRPIEEENENEDEDENARIRQGCDKGSSFALAHVLGP